MNSETVRSGKRTLREKLSLSLRGIRLAFQIYGARNILMRALMYITEYLPSYFEAFILSLIVNELAGQARKDRLTTLILLAVGGYFALYLFERWVLFLERSGRIMDWRKDQLYLLSIDNRISYAHVEDPEIHRLHQKMMNNPSYGYSLRSSYVSTSDFSSLLSHPKFSIAKRFRSVSSICSRFVIVCSRMLRWDPSDRNSFSSTLLRASFTCVSRSPVMDLRILSFPRPVTCKIIGLP